MIGLFMRREYKLEIRKRQMIVYVNNYAKFIFFLYSAITIIYDESC
jgi:hypothetical protein